MATRRETLLGGISLVAAAACRAPTLAGTTGDTGSTDGATDTGAAPVCKEKSTDNKVVLCLDDHPKLQDVDGSELVDSNAGKLIVVRTSEQKVIALSSKCTHAGCDVKWQKASSTLYCPCHGSEFDKHGDVLQGPANRPLPEYDAVLEGDAVTITL
jgi:cytochrome b6-f complex iron-sulfur subunit